MSKLNPYAKAIAGGLIAGLFAWLGVRDGGITSEEWTTVLAAIVSGSGLVWLVPNVPARAASDVASWIKLDNSTGTFTPTETRTTIQPPATGGPVSRGRPYIVGSDGDRELFVPLAPGTTTTVMLDVLQDAARRYGDPTQAFGFRRPDDPPLSVPVS